MLKQIAVTFAMALFLISRNKKLQESIRTRVFKRGVILRIWIVYVCVACMIFAPDFAV